MPITINGTGTVTGISAGGLPDGCIVTADLADGAATPAKTTGGPAFSAYQTNLQSYSNSVITKVTCETEEFDTHSCYDTATSRFTPNVAGYYQINGASTVTGSSWSSGYVNTWIYKNGSGVKRGVISQPNNPNWVTTDVSSIVYANGTTDYFEIYHEHNGAGTNPLNTVNGAHSYFNGCLIRPA